MRHIGQNRDIMDEKPYGKRSSYENKHLETIELKRFGSNVYLWNTADNTC